MASGVDTERSGPTLAGSGVVLAPLGRDHALDLVNAAADGNLSALKVTVVPDARTIDGYIATALSGRADGTIMPFAIKLAENGVTIGSTRFWKIDRKNRKLEIGYTWIAQSWQGTFVNPAIKYLMLRYAFEKLNCVRVQFQTDELNTHSRAAILRLGAKEEGVLRHERIMPDGRKRNSVRFSIIDDEWSNVKIELERRLKSLGVQPTFNIA